MINVAPTQSYNLHGGRAEALQQVYRAANNIIGRVDVAKRGSKRSNYLIVIAPDRAATTISDVNDNSGDGAAVGAVVWRTPFKEGPVIYMANTLVSSTRFYDLNADQNYDLETDLPTSRTKYLGLVSEGDDQIFAVLGTGRTKLAFSPKVAEMVKTSTTIEDACQKLEAWLESDEGWNYTMVASP